jgi:hypothetical protein
MPLTFLDGYKMPSYNLRHPETGEIEEHNCSIAQYEQLKEQGYTQVYTSTPSLVTHHGSVVSRTPDGYKDLLKNIKKHSGRGNTIKV